jgi:hypothetical protein
MEEEKMARYLFAYTLNTADQPDLFYSEEEKLNLEKLQEEMEIKKAPINKDGYFDGQGFGEISQTSILDKDSIESFCVTQGSLGNYNEARFEEETFTTEKRQHKYYTKSTIFITDESDFIIMFDNSIEEKAKSRVKAQVEEIGFDTSSFQINDKLIRGIQEKYTWSAATFNKIVKHGDSTKKVSFTIDPANDTDPSHVQEQYSDHGEMSHIKFELPYEAPGSPHYVTVTLYSDKNRIIIDENEFANTKRFNDFVVYLLQILKQFK